jgi:flagellar assembly factor FliW
VPITATRYFGGLEYEDENAIVFPEGLLGFEECRRFLLIRQADLGSLSFLQSLENPLLCFPVLPAAQVDPNFHLRLDPEHCRLLGLPEAQAGYAPEAILALAIVSFDEVDPPSANLLGPVVIHIQRKRAAQVVQFDSGYLARHPVPGFEEALQCS